MHWALTDRFLNISHRGGALIAPENTLEAIQITADLGVDVVEFDVFRSADGHLILIHDETLDRTTDGTGVAQEMTLSELQAFDAGYRFTPDGRSFPFRGQGVKIPTLEAVLTTFPDLYWDVEIKQPGIADDVVALIERLGLKDRVFLAAFEDEVIQRIRRDHPGWVTNFGFGEIERFAEADDDAYVPPGQILQVEARWVDEAFLSRARRHGLRVHVWTVNERAELERLHALGVDGLITDRPDLLRELTG